MGRSAKPLFVGSNPTLLSTLTLPVLAVVSRPPNKRLWRNGRRVCLRSTCRKAWGFESLQAHKKREHLSFVSGQRGVDYETVNVTVEFNVTRISLYNVHVL